MKRVFVLLGLIATVALFACERRGRNGTNDTGTILVGYYGDLTGRTSNFGQSTKKAEVYHAIEGSKGELGWYLISNGTGFPWRSKIRSPSFVNLQGLSRLLEGCMISDIVAIIGSIDPIMGEADK